MFYSANIETVTLQMCK